MAFTPRAGIESRKAGSPELEYIFAATGAFAVAARDISRGVVSFESTQRTRFATSGSAGGLVTPKDIPADGFAATLTVAPNSDARLLIDQYLEASEAYAGVRQTDSFISLTERNHTTRMETAYTMGGINPPTGNPVSREDGQGNIVYELLFSYRSKKDF